jgi:hypothetical protein
MPETMFDHDAAVAAAADAVTTAMKELEAIHADRVTPGKTLAGRRADAREVLAIAKERHTAAIEARAQARRIETRDKAADLRRQADTMQAKADHARASAEGQVSALYGPRAIEVLTGAGLYPIKATELALEATNLRGYAEQLDVEQPTTMRGAGL